QIRLASQIVEQQKAVLQITGEYARHMHTGGRQQRSHVDEGSTVFLRWRRIHENQAASLGLPAKIAAKAGVAAGRGQVTLVYGSARVLWGEERRLLVETGS